MVVVGIRVVKMTGIQDRDSFRCLSVCLGCGYCVSFRETGYVEQV